MNNEDTKSNNIEKYTLGKLTLYPQDLQCFVNGNHVKIHKRTFELLFLLASNPNKLFKMDYLVEHLKFVNICNLRNYVCMLRNELRAVDKDFDQIKTLYCSGYCYIPERPDEQAEIITVK